MAVYEGKGKESHKYLFTAPLGTTLPTDATTALSSAFINLGYVSDDGIVESNDIESNDIKDLNGEVVLTANMAPTKSYAFTLMEYLEDSVQKLVHGDANVTGSLSGTSGRTILKKARTYEDRIFVIESLIGNTVEREVITSACISEIGDVTKLAGEAIMYPLTIKAHPDADGNYSKVYQKTPTSSNNG